MLSDQTSLGRCKGCIPYLDLNAKMLHKQKNSDGSENHLRKYTKQLKEELDIMAEKDMVRI